MTAKDHLKTDKITGLTQTKGRVVVRVSYNRDDEFPVWVSYNTTPAYTSTLRMTLQDARFLLELLEVLK